MRYTHLILLGVAIPMLLTATVFAAPSGGGLSTMVNDATNILKKIGSITTAEALEGDTHTIVLSAEDIRTEEDLKTGLYGYRMVSHLIGDEEVTDERYGEDRVATIPGPTIVITEGDKVEIEIINNIEDAEKMFFDKVSLHVHGVHYTIENDGTLEHINMIGDQGASPGVSKSFTWDAGAGTAGTWPYHDHTFGGINGAEHKGLFGTLIVNPADGEIEAVDGDEIEEINVDDLDKEFVLYVGDDAFWGMEINADGKQTPLWTNPTLGAKAEDYVRFHLIALGTDTVHTFKLASYEWLDPGTDDLIKKKDIGPLENHSFTIKADRGTATYMDLNTTNSLMGMEGKFKVTENGADSIASPIPEAY